MAWTTGPTQGDSSFSRIECRFARDQFGSAQVEQVTAGFRKRGRAAACPFFDVNKTLVSTGRDWPLLPEWVCRCQLCSYLVIEGLDSAVAYLFGDSLGLTRGWGRDVKGDVRDII